jgi:hypothetical protein
MIVFLHRGLPARRSLGEGGSPHQFTPMSGAHKITAANARGRQHLPLRASWAARIAEFCRSTNV